MRYVQQGILQVIDTQSHNNIHQAYIQLAYIQLTYIQLAYIQLA